MSSRKLPRIKQATQATAATFLCGTPRRSLPGARALCFSPPTRPSLPLGGGPEVALTQGRWRASPGGPPGPGLSLRPAPEPPWWDRVPATGRGGLGLPPGPRHLPLCPPGLRPTGLGTRPPGPSPGGLSGRMALCPPDPRGSGSGHRPRPCSAWSPLVEI